MTQYYVSEFTCSSQIIISSCPLKDLEASLKREKELKVYLSQHVSVVEQLQTKLQLASQDVQYKESTLSQSKKVKEVVKEYCLPVFQCTQENVVFT